jgi:transposase
MARFDPTDAEWSIIAPLLPGADGKKNGRPRQTIARSSTGSSSFAHRHPVGRSGGALGSLHDGVQSLQSMGQSGHLGGNIPGIGGTLAAVATTDRLFDHPRPPTRRRRKKGGPDNAIGRSRGGLSTKINAVVDQAGMPVRIVLSQGQSSDKTVAPTLPERLAPNRDLIADCGYDARAIVDLVERRGGRAHIPTCRDRKVQRSVDPALYRQRNLIKRFFNKLKHFRPSPPATIKPPETSSQPSYSPQPISG